MTEEQIALAETGLADLLDKTKGMALAPDRLAVIAAARFGIMVAKNRANRGPWFPRGIKFKDWSLLR